MIIVKIGGGQDINHRAIVADLAEIDDQVILVHGANAARDRLARDLGKPVQTITSLSGVSSVLSDAFTMDAILMAYAGLINKKLVALCQVYGLNAVGLTGLDGGLIEGVRNAGIRTQRNGRKMMVRDFSGKPQKVNVALLRLLLAHGYIPVLTIPILDENSVPINSENDEIVALLHRELTADRIVQLIEAPGLLADPHRPESLVKQVAAKELDAWKQRVSGRMKRKMMALGKLFRHGAPRVYIGDGRVDRPLSQLFEGKGTLVQ